MIFDETRSESKRRVGFFPSVRFSWKALTLGILVIWVFAGIAWFIATPFIAVWKMRNAAINRDAETFCYFIDFPLFRENLKADLNAKMLFNVQNDPKLKDNPFSGLAAIAGPAMINSMVDGYVTPAAIEMMFKGQKQKESNIATETFNQDFMNDTKANVESAYVSFSEFQVAVRSPEGQNSVFVFERRGIFSWQLVRMKF
jgi:hypothetical protein